MPEKKNRTEKGAAEQHRAAVLGCGLMGSALARALARTGASVAAWNRTHSRAEALRPDGLAPIEAIGDAVASTGLLLACLNSYDDLFEALADADLADRTLVNLTTGTPEQAVEAEKWARAKGAAGYLDGAIICYPEKVGTEQGVVLLSGAADSWRRHGALLGALGQGTEYLGDVVQEANLIDGAMVHLFHIPALVATIEAVGFAIDAGVRPETLEKQFRRSLSSFVARADMVIDNVSRGDSSTTQASLKTYSRASRTFVDALQREGYGARMLEAAAVLLGEGERAGYGEQSITALNELRRAPRAS